MDAFRPLDRIDFAQPPETGAVLLRGGQRYEVVEVRTALRKDGAVAFVLVWRSHCATCGAPFELTTGLRANAQLNRRCSAHRAAGRPVKAAPRRPYRGGAWPRP